MCSSFTVWVMEILCRRELGEQGFILALSPMLQSIGIGTPRGRAWKDVTSHAEWVWRKSGSKCVCSHLARSFDTGHDLNPTVRLSLPTSINVIKTPPPAAADISTVPCSLDNPSLRPCPHVILNWIKSPSHSALSSWNQLQSEKRMKSP